ncbi:MAG TPA: hypothetical protein VN673_17815 [Clostridia bacterium]|nr:hypothetical protein [Clostridia bacterium]
MKRQFRIIALLNLALMLWLIPIVVFGDGTATNAVWGAPTGGIQMSLSLVPPGGPISTNSAPKLIVRYRNVTSQERFLWRTGPDNVPSLELNVESPTSKKVTLRTDAEAMLFGTGFVFLEPGREWQFSLTRSNFNPFPVPGVYTIKARQTVGRIVKGSGKMDPIELVSNPLQVHVLPGVSAPQQ